MRLKSNDYKHLFDLKGEEFKAAKKEVLKLKKITPSVKSIPFIPSFKDEAQKMTVTNNPDLKEDEVIVKVIANMAGYMDMDDDVLLRGCFSKSINDKGNNIPFLKDHDYSIDSIIAKTLSVSTQEIDLNSIGINSDLKTGEALIFDAMLSEGINKECMNKYKLGLIKEHSIGMRYMRLDLAVNDDTYEDEYKAWQKYFTQVINKGRAIEKGYFFAVQEIDLIENSAVVFGSNSKTPTLDIQVNPEAANSTSDQDKSLPPKEVQVSKVFSFYSPLIRRSKHEFSKSICNDDRKGS